MSRASTLARVLRDLKIEREEISEKKSAYDHDVNRAVVALARFTRIVENESLPDVRRGIKSEEGHKKAETGSPLPSPESVDQIMADDSDPTPAWAKKAYRLIVLKTHPDRIDSSESLTDSQKDRFVVLYKEAAEAYHQKDYETLVEIAAELDIDVDMPAADLEKALESKIKSARDEVAKIQKTLSWHWGISFGDLQKRVQVLKSCCKVMGIPIPENAVLEDIVRELESQPDFDIVDRLGVVRRIKSGADRRKTGERPVKRIS